MITRLTKIQLVIFVIVTLIGGTFVGARYAQIDRLVVDRTFPVTAQFPDSGGIFAGAEVTYRGIAVGRVGELKFNEGGVQARLDIEKSAPKVPADVLVVVANKSAIGEQYIDLQPRSSQGPYLKAGDRVSIENTRVPIDTTQLLLSVDALAKSVDTQSLQTLVHELGQAFEGAGDDLGNILDTTSLFISEANDNLAVTRQLIRDSATVLQTQVDSGSHIRAFSRDLALVTDTLVEIDPDLRRLLNQGSTAVRDVDVIVKENSENLSQILSDLRGPTSALVEPNEHGGRSLTGLQAVLVMYPYLIQGSYSALTPSDYDLPANVEGQRYNAAFGNVIQMNPHVCAYANGDDEATGYRERRSAQSIEDVEFNPDTRCGSMAEGLIPRRTENTTFLPRSAASDNGKDALAWLLLEPTQ